MVCLSINVRLHKSESSGEEGAQNASASSSLGSSVLLLARRGRRRRGRARGSSVSGISTAATSRGATSGLNRSGSKSGRDSGRNTLADVSVTVEVTVLVSLVEAAAVEDVGRVNADTTVDLAKLGEGGLGEVALHVDSTLDGLQLGEAVDLAEVSVVGNNEATVDGGQVGEGGVTELRVRVDGKGTNALEVGEVKTVKSVVDESQSRVDLLKLRDVNRRAVTESSVVSPLQVGERDVDLGSVVSNVQRASNLGSTNLNLVDVLVVVDVEVVNGRKVETLQALELSVTDEDVLSVLDTGVELELLKSRQSNKLDASEVSELGHAQGLEDGKGLQVKEVGDLLQGRSAEATEVSAVVDGKGTSDVLNTVQGEGVSIRVLDVDGSLELVAARDGVEIRLASGVDGRRAVLGASKRSGRNKDVVERDHYNFSEMSVYLF